ncbi:MAG: integrin alpha, partial [Gammaproteobacteria bacterium]
MLRLEKKALVTVVLSMGLVTTIGFSSASNVSDSIKTAMPDGNSPLAYTDNPRAENSGATGSEGVLVSSANTSNSDLAAVVKPAKYASTANKQSNSKDIPKDIPKSWLNQVQKDIAQREYHITWQDKTDLPKNKPAWQAPNRAHDFRTYFTEQGLTVVPRSGTKDWLWSLKLIAYGDELTNSEIKPEIKDNRIEYSHSVKLKEWYINNEQGLEQGFTLNAPANSNEANKSQATKNNNTLKLSFQLGGSLTATLTNNNQTISLKDKNKQQRFTFGKLKVIDANNKTLKSYFELDKQSQILTLVTNDSNAVYPITVDPVLSGASPFLEINLTDAVFGWSVASAGDVNGDGYGDVIIGAPYFSSGPIDEGAAFVYLGSPNGLNPTAAWTAKGNKASAFFGWSVASAGNVNGDVNAGNGLPIDDVIIGAVAYDNGVNISEGAVFVYLGSSTGLSSVADWNAVGNQRFVAFGNSVASAGDVDGDGYDDVIIGAPTYDKGQFDEGAAFVYLGSSTGLTKTFGSFGEPSKAPDWFAESNQDFSQFGISVASAGDVNGDGYSDVIIGASSYSNGQTNEGAVFVYLGSITGLTTTSGAAPELNPVADWSVESNQANSNFGISVASAGNINGDANSVTGIPIDAVIIGASLYDNDQSNEGAAFVYLGTTSGLSTSAAWTAESNQIGAQFGYSVASAGDVNGDGFGDVIIGANGYDSGESNEGAASVYLGNTNGLNPGAAWTAGSNQAGASFGISVASAGDVNGDGFGDVIVGARYYDNGEAFEGAASVFLGSSSGLSSVSIWGSESDKTYAYFGWSVASAGDVNGDGFGDVIVGAYGYDNGESNEGAAYVYLGTTNGLSSGAAWTVESNQIGALFGWSVASAGDVNGDGYGDVIVGANGYDSGESNEGVAFVYMGSSTGLTTAVNTGMGPSLVADWTAESNQADARFGISVASAGDVNGDGFGDVIVGADSYYTNGQFNEGAAFVYLGTFNGLSPVATWSAEGDQAYASFGISVASAGDVNGDGFGDVIVGANLYDNGESNEGAAFVYLGAANGLSPSAAWTAESNQADARFGISVASAGDVNGDGFGDVIVGARYYDNGESNEGAAFMYLGTMNGLSPSAAWT